MAVGPLARLLAQLVVPVVAVLARALPAAYAQALQNARKAGMDQGPTAANAAAQFLRRKMHTSEALQILNISEQEASAEIIQKQFEKYMAANDVSRGGSFYLQSKVYRAKELLDEYMQEKQQSEGSNAARHDQNDSTPPR